MKPIALTMGDAAGIGPEIVVKCFLAGRAAGCVAVGDVDTMRQAAHMLGVDASRVVAVDDYAAAAGVGTDAIPVLQASGIAPGSLHGLALGRVDARAGAAAHAAVVDAARAALAGEVAALVTAPIHKEAFHAAGVPFPGHTELLQDLCGGKPVRMMLANSALRTVLVTVHMSLRRAIDAISVDGVLETIRISHAAARGWGIERPRIAVAGLNPHAGEGGLFGDEEIRVIAPAIAAARDLGIDASGPHPPDTVFMRARHADDHPGEFDIVVAMLHDHGLIPIKYLGIEGGVNVSLGLPIVRTSPDHGTAFDIAGRGVADPASLAGAIDLARRLVV